MRIKEDIQLHGEFWLPDNKEGKVKGLITVVDGGKITLEIKPFFKIYEGNNRKNFKDRVGELLQRFNATYSNLNPSRKEPLY